MSKSAHTSMTGVQIHLLWGSISLITIWPTFKKDLTHTHMDIVLSWLTVVKGKPMAPFSIATTPRCRERCYSFPWLAPLTLDPYLIMLNVKQEGIKYDFLSLWHDSTQDRTLVSLTTGEHSLSFFLFLSSLSLSLYIYIYIYIYMYIYIYAFLRWLKSNSLF